jgi:hypothetical protein
MSLTLIILEQLFFLKMAQAQQNDQTNQLIDDNSSFNRSLSNENKTTNKRPKPYLKCVVCGDDAHGIIQLKIFQKINRFILGYNFDAIACESCKAFFRRNALRPPVKFFDKKEI